ncbi:hypothetical protein IJ00_20260 [Calothrix sp. 336/3]|nr:hypothetical protein IJ00_20260 [Calothrix sp. 336/3]
MRKTRLLRGLDDFQWFHLNYLGRGSIFLTSPDIAFPILVRYGRTKSGRVPDRAGGVVFHLIGKRYKSNWE